MIKQLQAQIEQQGTGTQSQTSTQNGQTTLSTNPPAASLPQQNPPVKIAAPEAKLTPTATPTPAPTTEGGNPLPTTTTTPTP